MVRQPDSSPLEERIAELEERVAYLESELGLSVRESEIAQLARCYDLRFTPAHVVLALYKAHGRILSRLQLQDAVWRNPVDDPSRNLFQAHICWARKALGYDAISTNWGRGYSLAPKGMALVAQALRQEAA